MRELASTFALLTFAILLPAACSSSSGGGANADKCRAACALPSSGPCAGVTDIEPCVTECEALTDGLTATCVQCMVEHTGWKGVECPANCSDCCPCPFGPGDGSTCEGGTGCSCTVGVDDSCTGYAIGKATSSSCKTACAVQ